MSVVKNIMSDFEFRRKIVHMSMGFVFIYFIAFEIIPINLFLILLAVILVVGLGVSLVVLKKDLPVITPILRHFDRKKHLERFPGRSAFYYIAGVIFSVLFFEKDIALASIAILALGDTFAHFVGRYYGKTKLYISKTKLFEGTLAGIVAATFGAAHFVPFAQALFGSIVAMFVEAIELEYFELDDNLSVPIAGGIAMTLFRMI